MTKQTQIKKQRRKAEPEPEIEEQELPPAKDQSETDALLDEIDEVLDDALMDESAAEFVKNYQQKGGE